MHVVPIEVWQALYRKTERTCLLPRHTPVLVVFVSGRVGVGVALTANWRGMGVVKGSTVVSSDG